MTRILGTEKSTQIGFMYLDSKGIVGFHQAAVS